MPPRPTRRICYTSAADPYGSCRREPAIITRSVNQVLVERSRRRIWLYLVYVVIWLIATIAIGLPVLAGLTGVLNQLDVTVRVVFYLMPPVLAALLVFGVLQIIAMYRYWFGPR